MEMSPGPEFAETLWELRNGEIVEFFKEEPTTQPYVIAVRIVPTPMPPGPVAPYDGKENTAPEQCALVAAERNNAGEWQWLWLGPNTKRWLIDWLCDYANVERDRWYFIGVHKDPMIIGAQVAAPFRWGA